MDKILNTKINIELRKIIGIYLLPFIDNIKTIKINCLFQLKDKTWSLCYNLSNNWYLDYQSGDYLKNAKIKRIKSKYSSDQYYWSLKHINHP
jgi:hypothetical protein